MKLIAGKGQASTSHAVWPFDIEPRKIPPFVVVRGVFTPRECVKIIDETAVRQAPRMLQSFYGGSIGRSLRRVRLDLFDHQWIARKLKKAAIKANSVYGFGISGLAATFDVLEYRRGDYNDRHHDKEPAKIAMSVALNSDYGGGRLLVEGGYDLPRVGVGDCVAMPLRTSHEVERVTSGSRIVLIAWCVGPDFF